jgi:hypothetical protein
VRSSVIAELHADYVRTAEAKGVSATGVVTRHVLAQVPERGTHRTPGVVALVQDLARNAIEQRRRFGVWGGFRTCLRCVWCGVRCQRGRPIEAWAPEVPGDK